MELGDRSFLASIICRSPIRQPAKGKDIVYTYSDIRICDERTGMNEPLVYELFCQEQCSVAMFGSDKR